MYAWRCKYETLLSKLRFIRGGAAWREAHQLFLQMNDVLLFLYHSNPRYYCISCATRVRNNGLYCVSSLDKGIINKVLGALIRRVHKMPPNPMKPFPPRSYPDASPSSSVLHDKLAGHQQASRLPSSSMKPHKKRVLDKEATLVVKDDPEDGGFSEEEGRKKKRKKRQKSKSRESSVHEDSLPKSDRVGTSTPPSHPAHSGQVSKKIKLESPVIAKWSERKGPREARIVTSPIAPSHLAGKSHNNGPTKGMSKSQTQQSQQHVKVEREKERNDHRVQLVQRQMAMLKEEAEKIKENADSRTAKAEKEAAALRSKLEGVERELKGLKSADEERVKASLLNCMATTAKLTGLLRRRFRITISSKTRFEKPSLVVSASNRSLIPTCELSFSNVE